MMKIFAAFILALGVFSATINPAIADSEPAVEYDYFYSLKKALSLKNYMGLRLNKSAAKISHDKAVLLPNKSNDAVFEMHFGSEIGKNITDYEFLVTITPTKGKSIDGYIGFGDNASMLNKDKCSASFTVLISFELKDGTVMASFSEITDTQSANTSYADYMGEPVLKFFINPGSASYTVDDVVIRQIIRSPFEM